MMAGASLPTAAQYEAARQYEVAPPRIMARPQVARFASEPEEAVEAPAPVIFASQTPVPAIRLESETEAAASAAEKRVAEVQQPVAEQQPRVAEVLRPVAEGSQPVADVPQQRPTYPVSSYYETARQQAWQEPAPRIEFASSAPPRVVETAHYEEPARREQPVQVSAPEEPKVVSYREPMRGPVIVEHIPEMVTESTTDPSQPESEMYQEMGSHLVAGTKAALPELLPVRASVFDDDFFRRPKLDEAAKHADEAGSKQWPDARVPSFAGYAAEGTAENDELDIPAFLRRKQ